MIFDNLPPLAVLHRKQLIPFIKNEDSSSSHTNVQVIHTYANDWRSKDKWNSDSSREPSFVIPTPIIPLHFLPRFHYPRQFGISRVPKQADNRTKHLNRTTEVTMDFFHLTPFKIIPSEASPQRAELSRSKQETEVQSVLPKHTMRSHVCSLIICWTILFNFTDTAVYLEESEVVADLGEYRLFAKQPHYYLLQSYVIITPLPHSHLKCWMCFYYHHTTKPN